MVRRVHESVNVSEGKSPPLQRSIRTALCPGSPGIPYTTVTVAAWLLLLLFLLYKNKRTIEKEKSL